MGTTSTKRLLIVDGDPVLRRSLERAMSRRGFAAFSCGTVGEARGLIETRAPSHMLLEIKLEDGSGLELLKAAEDIAPDLRAVVHTSYGSLATAVAATKLGAADFLAKPTGADEILAALDGADRRLGPSQTFPRPEDVEFGYLMTVFEQHDRNMSETARAIGMHRRTLQRILRRHGLQPSSRSLAERPSPRRRMIRQFRLWRGLLDGNQPRAEAPYPAGDGRRT